MNTKEIRKKTGKRIHWMDNLRTFIIFLVVVYHVGGVYEAAGMWGWFWIVDDPATISWVGILGIVPDIFMMGTLFFISGYLTPASLKNKNGWAFIKGKFRRLMIPWAIAVLTLIPLYKVIFLYSRGLPQEHWSTYFHITNPNSQNWLWFLPVLFSFDLLFLLLSKLNIRLPKVSLTAAVLGASLLGFIYSFFIGGVMGFRSWTLTPIIDFENERLLVYFLAFLLGWLFYSREAFAQTPQRKTLYIVISSIAWIPVSAHIAVRLYPILFAPGSAVTPAFRAAWWLTFQLALLSMVYVMVETFWRYLDRTNRVWSELNRNSYGVYIIHVIVIGVFGTLLLNVNLPAVVKYLLLIVLAYVGSNLLVSAYRSLRQALRAGRKQAVSETAPSKTADVA